MYWPPAVAPPYEILPAMPPVLPDPPENRGTVLGKAPRTPPDYDSCRPYRSGSPCFLPSAQRIPAQRPTAGQTFHVPPLVPVAAPASNISGKHAKPKPPRPCLPAPVPP